MSFLSNTMYTALVGGLLLLSTTNGFSQGCSDAGACSLHGLRPDASDSTGQERSQIRVGAFFGLADFSITAPGAYVEYRHPLAGDVSVQARVSSLAQIGNGISVFGASDIFVSGTWGASKDWTFTLGAKIPLTAADAQKDGLPLPMDYQSSLGTFDVVAGASFDAGGLLLTAGFQYPLTQNTNLFLAEAYPEESPLREFPSTNMFQRSADVLLRISYPVLLSNTLTLTPSLLPIYHVSNDSYSNAAGTVQEIVGSKGLTLNVNVFADYVLSDTQSVQVGVAVPVVVREVRPDGLTRGFLATLEFRQSL